MPWAVAIGMAAVMIGAGVLVIWVAVRAADGRLSRNPLAGVRTRATMASDEAWLAGHQAARNLTVAGGAVSVLAGVLLLFRPSNALGFAVLMVASGLLVALVIGGGYVGDRAAKETLVSQGSQQD